MAKLRNAPKPDQSHERNQGSLYSVSSNSTKSVDDKLERMNTTQSRERLFLKQQLQIQAMPQEDSTIIMHCTVNHAPILASLQYSTLALSLTSLVFYSLTACLDTPCVVVLGFGNPTSLLSSTLPLTVKKVGAHPSMTREEVSHLQAVVNQIKDSLTVVPDTSLTP